MKLKNLPDVEINEAALDGDTIQWLRDLDEARMERHIATLVAWYDDVYPKLLATHLNAVEKCAEYAQIEDMMAPSDAADALMFHAQNIANALKRKDNAAFGPRVASIKAILLLIDQYVRQDNPEYGAQILQSPEDVIEKLVLKSISKFTSNRKTARDTVKEVCVNHPGLTPIVTILALDRLDIK